MTFKLETTTSASPVCKSQTGIKAYKGVLVCVPLIWDTQTGTRMRKSISVCVPP